MVNCDVESCTELLFPHWYVLSTFVVLFVFMTPVFPGFYPDLLKKKKITLFRLSVFHLVLFLMFAKQIVMFAVVVL